MTIELSALAPGAFLPARSQELLLALQESLKRQLADTGNRRVEVVRGGGAVSALCYGAAAACRSESLSLEPLQSQMPLTETMIGDQIDLALSRRGVLQRVIIAQPIAGRNDAEIVQALAEMGQPARYHPAVPLRLLVYDRSQLFMAIDPSNTRVGAYVTTDESLVELACQLFEDLWDDAGTPPPVPADTSPPVDITLQVLRQLANGLKDDAIARRLGVSTRTVRRIVAQLLVTYGTSSRFQLAMLMTSIGQLTSD